MPFFANAVCFLEVGAFSRWPGLGGTVWLAGLGRPDWLAGLKVAGRTGKLAGKPVSLTRVAHPARPQVRLGFGDFRKPVPERPILNKPNMSAKRTGFVAKWFPPFVWDILVANTRI